MQARKRIHQRSTASALMVVALWFVGPARAAEVHCPNCTEAQAAVTARNAGIGVHYVYDIPGNAIRKYSVEREPNGVGGYDYFVFQDDVEQEARDAVSLLSTAWRETGGTMFYATELIAEGATGGLTAWDVFQNGPGQQTLRSWLANTPFTWQNAAAVFWNTTRSQLAVVVNILKSNPIAVKTTAVFHDGSRIDAELDLWNKDAKIVPSSAHDALGNVIPTSINDLANTNFDYSGDPTGQHRNRMIGWLGNLGVPIGTGVRWACTISAAGVHCKPY